MALLPPIYRATSFWTSSPTFFLPAPACSSLAIPIAYAWTAVARGRISRSGAGDRVLFVYWIHVEMVYGVLSWPIIGG